MLPSVCERDDDRWGVKDCGSGLKKSQIRIVSSWDELTIWNSSNCNRNTLPECCTKVWRHKALAGDRGSKAAAKSHTLILL